MKSLAFLSVFIAFATAISAEEVNNRKVLAESNLIAKWGRQIAQEGCAPKEEPKTCQPPKPEPRDECDRCPPRKPSCDKCPPKKPKCQPKKKCQCRPKKPKCEPKEEPPPKPKCDN